MMRTYKSRSGVFIGDPTMEKQVNDPWRAYLLWYADIKPLSYYMRRSIINEKRRFMENVR